MRRKKQSVYITLYDKAGACCARHALVDFPLPEKTIRRLSIHFFNDPEPCHIHRAAVLMRAMEELRRIAGSGARHSIELLPEDKRDYFDANTIAAFSFETEALP